MARAFTGTVRDKNGALVSGRTVQVIRDVDNVCVSKTTTDANGEFISTSIITESGTVTTASASVITDSAQAWTVDGFADHHGVLITSGTQQGEWRKIASNTATALTLDSALPGPTSVNDTFEVAALHTLVFNGEADRNALVYAGVMPTSDPVFWTPAEITTALWLDAADSGTITLIGGNVSQWDDKSTNNRHATQDNSTQPVLMSAEVNGLDAIRFDGLNDLLTSTQSINIQSAQTFVVGKTVSGLGRYIERRIGTSNSRYYITAGLGYYVGASGVSVSVTTNLAIHCLRSLSGAQAAWTDGAANGTATDANTDTHTSFPIGGGTNGNPSYGNVDVCEVIHFDTPVDDTTREKIEGYLAHKWGIAANLPALHPYKTDPPVV